MHEVKSQHFFNRYLKFIEYCRSSKKDSYGEHHHIIPKSMGGTNDNTNLIFLTYREHFISHLLLWKSFQNKETNFALWSMRMGNRNFKLNSKSYSKLKEQHSKLQSDRMKMFNPMFNEESKEKISKSRKGKKASLETKQKMSMVRKGVKKTEETKNRISISSKNKKKSEEHRLNLSKNHANVSGSNNPMFGRSVVKEKNLKWYNNGYENKFIPEGTQPIGWNKGRIMKK